MRSDDMQTISQVIRIIETNSDIATAVINANHEWSEYTCSDLIGTYNYIVEHRASDLEAYMEYLQCLVRLYNPIG